ncbi:MAG: phosphoglucosamine mutase [Saprospiraceae bacterium]
MTLIKSISGIRGTIGGKVGSNLTPPDIVAFSAAYGQWALQQGHSNTILIGRDARISGDIVSSLVSSTLRSLGINVIDLGLSTTPTVEMAVATRKAAGGIILTASHNPIEWNALKFLNHLGEFISQEAGQEILDIAGKQNQNYKDTLNLGTYTQDFAAIHQHLAAILALPMIDLPAIRDRKFHIVVDCINSTGSISVAPLLDLLGCTYELIFDDLSGHFAHNPEPLEAHLTELSDRVKSQKADLGISVDPDVDRLAFVMEDGKMFGEEYTIVAIADFLLTQFPSANTVSNLSSTRALRDITLKHGGRHFASAVGEVHVVKKMKEVHALVGGEGNGGVIFPTLHNGRDALVGIALFLSHLAQFKGSISQLKAIYPAYFMVKEKMTLEEDVSLSSLFEFIESKYPSAQINTEDGLKIDLPKGWVHVRSSNTEPIIRIYTEANTHEYAQQLASDLKSQVAEFLQNIEIVQ